MQTVLDIATYQQSLNIEALPGEGVAGVIHKAGGANGGSLYVDSGYRRIAPRIRVAGLKLGHYFFNGPVDAVRSADFFVDSLTAYLAGDVLALDVEGEGQQEPAWALRWFQRVLERVPGANLWLYTTQSIATDPGWDQVVRMGVRLWIAAPGDSTPSTGRWPSWGIHQHSWTGRFAGYAPLDTNTAVDDAWRSDEFVDGTPDQLRDVLAPLFEPLARDIKNLLSL